MVDKKEREKERKKGERKDHASDMHRCSPHTGQFIKIIKLSLALKVKPPINLTGIQKERL